MDKSALLAFDDRPVKKVEMPGWPGPVNLRAPAVGVVFKIQGLTDESQALIEMVHASFVDEHGSPLFDRDEAEAFVNNLGPKSLMALSKKITEAIGIGEFADADSGESSEGN